MQNTALTGIVLAGGQSRRLGKDKALLEYKGSRLIDYPITILEKYCSHILISANKPLPLAHHVIPDVYQDNGPLVGIYSCLLYSKTIYNIVLTCDMPFVTGDLIDHLIANIDSDKIIVPVHHDTLLEPLCAIYPTSSGPSMLLSIEKKQLALRDYINNQPHTFINITDKMNCWSDNLFTNINTTEDFERIQQY
jgi:molybdenum cofactor guanylyltransferase